MIAVLLVGHKFKVAQGVIQFVLISVIDFKSRRDFPVKGFPYQAVHIFAFPLLILGEYHVTISGADIGVRVSGSNLSDL